MLKWYSWVPRILQTLAWVPTRLLLAGFCHFQVSGIEHLKELRQAIFAVNHSSELDPVLLTGALSPFGRFSPMFYLAGPREMFRHERFGLRRYIYTTLFFKAWGAYSSPKGLRDYTKALIVHTTMLLEGRSLCVFPEGFVTKTGELGEPRGGFIHLCLSSGVPIVPVAISGIYKMSLVDFLGRRRQIIIEYGKPITAEAILSGRSDLPIDEHRSAAAKVFEEISTMLEGRHVHR